ncbi:hypothetical protein GCK72_018670 [Caenorhabditis remanei]|uniref:7TM GPCR serpentine receptor class x (Srx) domain-containing protein n=1 Tax=Caenorhabditis remanei TaxID=31234 RepID=A0A6A5GB99_CAERE|nr:hypothetical protein GCK72_018670 [Caenorhabditis remanei]KAF1752116.1 hypothetical protein GCK72_018670 [Caenorhabditis remanei]
MLFVSVIGVLINVFLFWKFFKKDRGGGFLTFCLAKTVPNTIVCSAFLFWVVPITALSLDYKHVPRLINVFVGQVAGFGAYVAGAIIEMFMAINRCSVIYCPSYNFKNANYVVIFVFMVSMVYVLLGLIPKRNSKLFAYDRHDKLQFCIESKRRHVVQVYIYIIVTCDYSFSGRIRHVNIPSKIGIEK